jgi:hypothetical protein
MSDNCFMVLQTDTDIRKDLPGLCSEKHAPSSRDAKQLMSVKGEEVWTMQEEEVPVPITWQAIKTEHEVRQIGCRVVSAADPCGHNLGFLDQSCYSFFQVAPLLYSRG